MSFAFNFGGDDIDTNGQEDGVGRSGAGDRRDQLDLNGSPNVFVQEHNLQEWLNALPSQISYSTVTITSPTGKTLHVPRRELFDVRQQLMAEDADATLHDLEKSDLRTNIYEGGFKTWECSVDLASLLLDRGPRKDIDELCRVADVVELGAGTALPSLVLFQHALRNGFAVGFTLADYNSDVLRLVSVPNLLLAYARFGSQPVIGAEGSGELDVTPGLIDALQKDLAAGGITLKILSGPWGTDLVKLIPPSTPDMSILLLAAETIYSPSSLEAFVNTLTTVLKGGKSNKALVAAKKFYFGVGGSVDALKVACRHQGLIASEVENSGLDGMSHGVGRAIVEVQTL